VVGLGGERAVGWRGGVVWVVWGGCVWGGKPRVFFWGGETGVGRIVPTKETRKEEQTRSDTPGGKKPNQLGGGGVGEVFLGEGGGGA